MEIPACRSQATQQGHQDFQAGGEGFSAALGERGDAGGAQLGGGVVDFMNGGHGASIGATG